MSSRIAGLWVAVALTLFAAPPTAAAPGASPATGFLTLEQLRAHYGRPGDQYADIGGLSVRYRDEGKGQALVLLHGSFGSLNSYDDLVTALGDRYRIIRLDLPGMGLSSTIPARQATSTPTADDIVKTLLDQLGVTRAILVGVSSGGTLGYYFTAAHPDMVQALVLSNTPSKIVSGDDVERSPALKAEFDEAARTGFKRLSYWKTYLEWLSGRTERMTPQIVSHYYDLNRREPFPDARLFGRRTRDQAATQAALAAVKVPTLLVWGARDLVLPLDTAKALEGYLRGATVSKVILEDVGHYPTLETPERFAHILNTYVTQVLAPPEPIGQDAQARPGRP